MCCSRAGTLLPEEAWRLQSMASMLKKLLFMLGLRKAPPPVRSYFAASSLFGVAPALAYVAWKNRDKIRPLLQRATGSRGVTAAHGSTA